MLEPTELRVEAEAERQSDDNSVGDVVVRASTLGNFDVNITEAGLEVLLQTAAEWKSSANAAPSAAPPLLTSATSSALSAEFTKFKTDKLDEDAAGVDVSLGANAGASPPMSLVSDNTESSIA